MKLPVVAAAAVALLAGVLVPTAGAEAATGTVYAVDCSAQTNGDGIHAPFNTLAAVTDHGAFQPGDQILFKRGTTCKGRVTPTGSGTAGHPIVLGAYGSGALPTLAGGGTGNKTAVVLLANVREWTVQDLHITNKGTSARTTSSYRAGVAVRNWGIGRAGGITIQRLHIDNVVSSMNATGDDSREYGAIVAITQGPGTKDGYDGLTIRNNVISHVGRTGIMVSNHEYPKSTDKNVRVYSNTISYARGDSIVLRGVTSSRIDHNVSANGSDEWPCSNCGPITPATANAAIWTAFSKGVRIDHNEVYGEKAKGGDGEAFDADASAIDTVVEYNYAHDNEGGAMFFCGSTNAIARFNIFVNNKKSAFAFIGNMPAKNTKIYNNTVYQSKKTDAGTVRYFNGKGGSGIKFYNNIVYNYGRAYYLWPAKVTSKDNTFIGNHGTGEPHGAGYTYTNPQLKKPGTDKKGISTVSAYKPAHPKTFRKGAAIPSSVTTDFFGKKISAKKPPRGAAG